MSHGTTRRVISTVSSLDLFAFKKVGSEVGKLRYQASLENATQAIDELQLSKFQLRVVGCTTRIKDKYRDK
jgi:hypothetical protein